MANDKLAALRAAKAELDQKRQAEADDREVALLELELKLEADIGPRGHDWEIVEDDGHGEGPIAVQLGASVLQKRFEAELSSGKLKTSEDFESYVLPCIVFPEKDKVQAIFDKRPFLITRCANALAILYGVARGDAAGK
jgi:hypothetical protein